MSSVRFIIPAVECDHWHCTAIWEGHAGDSIKAVRRRTKELGWKRETRGGGAFRDFCPAHADPNART